MPLVRSKSQSSCTPQSTNIFTDLKHWGKRRTSNTAPPSLRLHSASTNITKSLPALVGLSRSYSEHSTRSNQQPQHALSTNNENNPSVFAGTSTSPSETAPPENTALFDDTEMNNTTRIRLLPNVELASKCFVFDIIDRTLSPTTLLKIGRYSERHFMPDRLVFKSKVVSRMHAELWMEEGNKVFIRDIGSSSGTFINRVRLSKANETSQPMKLQDGDIIQLGIDYQNDYQDAMDQMYRAVKMRLEINKDTDKINNFSRQAFLQFRQHFLDASYSSNSPTTNALDTNNNGDRSEQLEGDNPPNSKGNKITGPFYSQHTHNVDHELSLEGQYLFDQNVTNHDTNQNNTPCLQECCICLCAIAPLQALFIAPCSHGYHFKCLRPLLLQHYPGFSCPLCRNYYDLEASVAENMESSSILNEKPTAILPILSAPST